MEFSGLSKWIQSLARLAKLLYKKRAKIIAQLVIVGYCFPRIAFAITGEKGSISMHKSTVGDDIIYMYLITLAFVAPLGAKWLLTYINLNGRCFIYGILDELSSLFGNILLIISGYLVFVYSTFTVHNQNWLAVMSVAAFFMYAVLEYISYYSVVRIKEIRKERADKKACTRQTD
ncbi:hypothetical protein B7R74_04100 [Yersinia pseudotuberculosis]|uniref:Uncharacterized protein n=1 Tax=Yersinia pseudotuberculosis TaxID=633 RepID=A0A380QAZ6_YERPU|nr:hypothetical protein [Yersinia pseudotuberculosis]PSH23207.1 hypothetical protein B7R74_04100 [Yersinia pseudotuberculosis]SUP83440.1 Uncharacterised protein [Yersinia pseudotuberculosis]